MTFYGLDEQFAEKCSSQSQFDLISLLVNFAFEVDLLMGKYDFQEVARVVLIHV